ncbi:sensor domain-containing diguanylate cyclase [Rubinisphaera margarita]|uniref:sensor domain-containing diguanylate cyclase n=1 Tax=Rubinisphaera margarita TaxID=2909586 RepID=UPI001EE9AD8C|nr:GGDEF domain-containing protein [Rubinisphaera margarita]MCG6154704.1 GGDEF domain-containing protein [Rubinisphaera margarita]
MFDAEKIWKSTTLPTLPAVAVRLLELARDPETEMTQIVDLIKTDPAIASRILQATNSAFFSFSSKVNSIDRAVPLLGTTVVTSLALSFSLASESISSGPLQDYYRSYWKQSIVHAAAGETIGKRCQAGLECEYFLAGLLVDIGRLAMLKAISREYYPVLVTSESQARPLFEVEHEFLGLDHSQVACRLMEKWGLPENLMNGVRMQNFSVETLFEQLQPGTHSLEAAIVLSNAVGDYFMSPVPGKSIQRIRQMAEHFFNMKGAEVDRFLQEVRQRVDDAGSLFAIDMSDINDPGEIMSQANQQLLELTMRAQSETLLASERQKQIEREKQQLESRNAELQQKATRDPLTGIFNRAHFDESMKNASREASDRCSAICVMFMDIDKFKVLNDTYGHKFGDDVLKQFTKVVSRSLRQSDVFCRYGGEEFVVIVHRPTEKGVEKLAERVRAAIEREDFLFDGKRVPVTSSFGTALGMPGRKDYNFGEQLLLQADEALYDSKKNGRNQVHHRCLMNSEEREMIKAVNGLKFSRWLVSKEILDIPTVSRILLQVPPDQRSLGELAVDLKMLEPLDIEALAEMQNQGRNQRFGELAVETGLLTQTQLYLLLSFQIEPPDRLMNALTANSLFSAERSRELCNQFMKTIPAESIPVAIV